MGLGLTISVGKCHPAGTKSEAAHTRTNARSYAKVRIAGCASVGCVCAVSCSAELGGECLLLVL